jgi:holo-[acyl-carrier protein] synthase
VIVGFGIEWLDVPRFEAVEARFGERLQRRLFTPGEREFAARKARGHESLAVRLAAKIAARRALGMPAARWQELEVCRVPGRRPEMRFHGAAAAAAERLGVTHVALTLTHDAAACLSQVVLERREEPS